MKTRPPRRLVVFVIVPPRSPQKTRPWPPFVRELIQHDPPGRAILELPVQACRTAFEPTGFSSQQKQFRAVGSDRSSQQKQQRLGGTWEGLVEHRAWRRESPPVLVLIHIYMIGRRLPSHVRTAAGCAMVGISGC